MVQVKESWNMNPSEKVAAVLKRMNEGYLLLKHGKFNLAAKKYEKVDRSVFFFQR